MTTNNKRNHSIQKPPLPELRDRLRVRYKIGERHVIRKSDNSCHSAEIIDIRYDNRMDGGKRYYVHYEGQDRRLDEWVTRDQFSTNSVNPPDLDQKDPLPPCSPMTRSRKRIYNDTNHVQKSIAEMSPFAAASEKDRLTITRVKNIDVVRVGQYEIDAWYYSPYPSDYWELRKLWICEFCFKYMKLQETYRSHKATCPRRQPPGKEIYRKATLSVYEVDGAVDKPYCQNLCLLAKFFIDHKAVFFNTEMFLFYILCEVDRVGAHIVGYFSKEKISHLSNNVACILTFPQFQRKGYGKFLIAFSYELSKIEGVVGSPEKPLSDLGKRSYQSYWSWILLQTVQDSKYRLTISDLSRMTSITEDDIIETFRSLNMIRSYRRTNVLMITPKLAKEYLKVVGFRRPSLTVDRKHLRWNPPKKSQNKRSRAF